MGYCMKQIGCEGFLIKAKNKVKAFQAIQALAMEIKKSKERFHWFEADEVLACKNLNEVLTFWEWEPEEDENGDIVSLSFVSEKLGDEVKMFKAIAPFVKKGAYIEMSGEEGHLWRWIFNGKHCDEKAPKISYK